MPVSEDNKRILITIPIEIKKQLEEAAKLDNRSVSNYVLKLIKEDLEKK